MALALACATVAMRAGYQGNVRAVSVCWARVWCQHPECSYTQPCVLTDASVTPPSCPRASRPAFHHTPQGIGQEAPVGWFRPSGPKTKERNPASPALPPEPRPLSGGLGPRNNLSMGEAAPSAWQCPIHHLWPQCQGPSWGSRPFEGAPSCARLTRGDSNCPLARSPHLSIHPSFPLHKRAIGPPVLPGSSLQTGCPRAWPPSLGVPTLKTHFSSRHWGPPHAR